MTERADVASGNERNTLRRLEGAIAMAKGDEFEAVEILNQVIDVDPLDGKSRLVLAEYYVRNDSPEKALSRLEEAAEIEASEADAKIKIAEIYVRQKKYAEAIPLLERSLELNDRRNVAEFLEKVKAAAKPSR